MFHEHSQRFRQFSGTHNLLSYQYFLLGYIETRILNFVMSQDDVADQAQKRAFGPREVPILFKRRDDIELSSTSTDVRSVPFC